MCVPFVAFLVLQSVGPLRGTLLVTLSLSFMDDKHESLTFTYACLPSGCELGSTPTELLASVASDVDKIVSGAAALAAAEEASAPSAAGGPAGAPNRSGTMSPSL
jgi:hypothetical protein